MYCGFLVFLLTIVPPLLLWWKDSSLLKEILKDLRPLRILHYIILTLLGAHVYYNLISQSICSYQLNPDYIFQLLTFTCALVYSAVFAIISNNIEDVEADRITNPDRPLVKNTVDRKAYLTIGLISQFIALIISMVGNWFVIIGTIGISFGYFLYSCSPLRLKRIPFIAKFMIGFNSFIAALTGYAIAGGNPTEFPLSWAIFILVPLSLAANFIDLKDIEGDRLTGIKTLPVIFGEKNAKIIIAISTIVTYSMAGFLLNKLWVLPIGALGLVLHMWFLLKTPFQEKPVFLIYITSLLALVILLLFN